MRPAPIARYLVELEADGPKAARVAGAEATAGRLHAVAEAHAKGFEEGKAAAEAQLAARLEEQAAIHRRELAAAREHWARLESERICEHLAAGLRDLETRVADSAARILKPFLATELRRKAVADLVETLSLLRTTGSAAAVAVTGPADLLDALRAGLQGKLDNITFHPGQDADARVTVGRTLLETQLGAWIATIEEATA